MAPKATVCETSHGDYIPKKMLNVVELDNYVTTKLLDSMARLHVDIVFVAFVIITT